MRLVHRELQRREGRRPDRGLRGRGDAGHALERLRRDRPSAAADRGAREGIEIRIAAGLIELHIHDADSLKARRRVARAVVDRLRHRFNASVAELGDLDDRHSVCVGYVMLGRDPRRLRVSMEKVVRFVERLGLAEVVADDVTIVQLDELAEEPEGAPMERDS